MNELADRGTEMGGLAFLFGALIGTLLISRLFWAATKAWPNSIGKAVSLNVACAAIIIPADYLLRGNVSFIQELAVYGGCQAIVLALDLWRIRRNQVGARPA
jgi:hypothetical protein